jgi:hypothetical protein
MYSLCYTSIGSDDCLVFLLYLLFLCWLGMNPNPGMLVFFHHACAGGRASPQFLLLAVISFLVALGSPYGPVAVGSRHHLDPPSTATLAAPSSGLLSSPPPPPLHLSITSGGTGLTAPLSSREGHQ